MAQSSTHATAPERTPGTTCRNPACPTPDRVLLPGQPHRGFCGACYGQAYRAGFPGGENAEPRKGGWPLGRPRRSDVVSVKQENYAWLRSQGVGVEDAAARAGVSLNTAMRTGAGYEDCVLASRAA